MVSESVLAGGNKQPSYRKRISPHERGCDGDVAEAVVAVAVATAAAPAAVTEEWVSSVEDNEDEKEGEGDEDGQGGAKPRRANRDSARRFRRLEFVTATVSAWRRLVRRWSGASDLPAGDEHKS